MTRPATNRDLYLAIGELGQHNKANARTLEQYLCALLQLARPQQNQDALSPTEFHRILSEAFDAPPAAFDESWREAYPHLQAEHPGFEGWKSVLIRQIVDLREMTETGQLLEEHRYFGIDAPRGARWYNFDPVTYIECAAAGALGGWEPQDDTPRQFVPGSVAVMGPDGKLTAVDPHHLERPVINMPPVSWALFKDFIECGQMYE